MKPKKLSQEDDFRLLNEFNQMNRVSYMEVIKFVLFLFMFRWLYLNYQWIFWVVLLTYIVSSFLTVKDNSVKAFAIKNELKMRRLI